MARKKSVRRYAVSMSLDCIIDGTACTLDSCTLDLGTSLNGVCNRKTMDHLKELVERLVTGIIGTSRTKAKIVEVASGNPLVKFGASMRPMREGEAPNDPV